MSQRFVQNPWNTDVITTANATPVSSGVTFTPPANCGGTCEMKVIARNTATNAMVSWHAEVPFKMVGSTLTVGTLLNLGGAALAAVASAGADLTAFVGATIALLNTSNVLTPQVTGLAATSIEWLLSMKYDVN